MAEEYAGRGLVVLAVNVAGDSSARIEEFVEQNELAQRFIPRGRRLARHYNVKATPTTIFIDPEGAMVHRQLGARPISEMRKRIEEILPEG